jgi:hypothetical protein
MARVKVEIINWDKFNPRKDIKATHWFRLDNAIFENPDFFDFSHAEICFFVYLLSQASKKMAGAISLNLEHANRIGRFSDNEITSALDKLEQLSIIKYDKNEYVTQTLRIRDANDTLRTNEQNITNKQTILRREKSEVTKKPKGAASHPHAYLFIAEYVKAYQKRYGPKARPDLRGKVSGQISIFLKDYTLERAVELIQAYCQMDGQKDWFKTKGHDFMTFLENLNPVSIALERGDESDFDWNKVFGPDTSLKVLEGGA